MPILNSPGVSITEVNNTIQAPSNSSSSAALEGYSTIGPLGVTLVISKQMFLNLYGNPQPATGSYFHYSALAYLAQGNQLYCQRVLSTAKPDLCGGIRIQLPTSAQSNTGLSVGIQTPAYAFSSAYPSTAFIIFGANPGSWNNNIGITIVNIGTGHNLGTNQFDIQVWYTNNTSNVAQIVETWIVTRTSGLNGQGQQTNLQNVINGYSAYIVAYDSGVDTSYLPKANPTAATPVYLTGGTDAVSSPSTVSVPVDSEIGAAWTASFTNADNYPVRILINGGYTGTATQSAMCAIATSRTDCVAILDIPYTSVLTTTTMTNWQLNTADSYNNNSYNAVYGPWITDQDNYNNILITLPPSGYVAARYAWTDNNLQVWDAPAGTTNGLLPVIGCTGMSSTYPQSILQQGDRDVLVAAQINPIQNFRGQGIMLFEQKTSVNILSDVSSINVRRSLIQIELSLKQALRGFLFKRNNNTTRLQVYDLVYNYLSTLDAQGAFDDSFGPGFGVVCNTTNNSPAQIQNLELHCDIYVIPILAVEKLYANVIITLEGTNLSNFTSGQLL